MNISGAATLARTAELSLAEKGLISAKVVLTGFVIVFLMLILLIIIIKIYSTIVVKAQRSDTNKKKKDRAENKSAEKPVLIKPDSPPSPSAAQNGVPDEVVAVISAAVVSACAPQSKVKIKSIKKSNGGRSAWANAGVLDNTRPF